MATLNFLTTSLHPKTLTTKPTLHYPSKTLIHLPKSPIFESLNSVIKPKTLIAPPIRSTTTTISDTASAPQTLKSRLKNGETLYGLFLLSFSPTIAEIAGLSGYDFVVVDMEHGPGGISEALSCLHALAAARTPAIIRLPDSDAAWAKKALDLGPQGIMFPMIESQKMAKKAVSYCKFPPNGVRGSAHTIIRASDYGIDSGYLNNYEDELLIMCQGVLKAKGGCAYLSGFAMPHDKPEEMRGRGYRMISGAVDVGLFRSACVEDVKRFKMMRPEDEIGNVKDGDGDEKYWSE
ncbi:hypothetical protein E3N88_16785 [Mikania micrantha]|uniref:HpcH/HpaI aldolase/citrate lyase domain-containing protein n=1 Tax=Mikania micrantha TaxID=192012 RepID=A0A5N6NR89_9ASTR|nr:hypothetical protein E3N88_16785 [Mikania micrantha]